MLAGRKQPTDGQIMLRELVRFFLDVKIHEHATYFVDSLWDYTEVLKVCKAVTSTFQSHDNEGSSITYLIKLICT